MERNEIELSPTNENNNPAAIEGMESTTLGGGAFLKMTHGYQSGNFLLDGQGVPNSEHGLEICILKYRAEMKKNFECVYDKSNPTSPTCFSLDGRTGSKARTTRMLDGKMRNIYGNCADCAFGQFGSAGLWKNKGETGKAPNCKSFALILGIYNGQLIMIQVPPTGVQAIAKSINIGFMQANLSPRSFYYHTWRIMPRGGGRNKDYMSIALGTKFDNQEQTQSLREAGLAMSTAFNDYCEKFASGVIEDEEAPQGSAAMASGVEGAE